MNALPEWFLHLRQDQYERIAANRAIWVYRRSVLLFPCLAAAIIIIRHVTGHTGLGMDFAIIVMMMVPAVVGICYKHGIDILPGETHCWSADEQAYAQRRLRENE